MTMVPITISVTTFVLPPVLPPVAPPVVTPPAVAGGYWGNSDRGRIKELYFTRVYDSQLGTYVLVFKSGYSWTTFGLPTSAISRGAELWVYLDYYYKTGKIYSTDCSLDNDEDNSAFEAGTLNCTCYGILNNKLVFGNSCPIHGCG